MDWLVFLLPGICVSAVVGFLLGNSKNKGAEGALVGALFGPLGWLFILMMKDERPKCRLCQGTLPSVKVSRCKHCGGELRPAKMARPGVDPVDEWEQQEARKPENLKPLQRKPGALRPSSNRDR